MPLKKGDKVIIKNETEPLTIREIVEHKNFRVGPKDYTVRRLYFVEKHQPEFEWRISKILDTEN